MNKVVFLIHGIFQGSKLFNMMQKKISQKLLSFRGRKWSDNFPRILIKISCFFQGSFRVIGSFKNKITLQGLSFFIKLTIFMVKIPFSSNRGSIFHKNARLFSCPSVKILKKRRFREVFLYFRDRKNKLLIFKNNKREEFFLKKTLETDNFLSYVVLAWIHNTHFAYTRFL